MICITSIIINPIVFPYCRLDAARPLAKKPIRNDKKLKAAVNRERMLLVTYDVDLVPSLVDSACGVTDSVSVKIRQHYDPAKLATCSPQHIIGDGNCLFRSVWQSGLPRTAPLPGCTLDLSIMYTPSAALASYYPPVPRGNEYSEAYTRQVHGRGVSASKQPALTVIWTQCVFPQLACQFAPNHFVPLCYNNIDADVGAIEGGVHNIDDSIDNISENDSVCLVLDGDAKNDDVDTVDVESGVHSDDNVGGHIDDMGIDTDDNGHID